MRYYVLSIQFNKDAQAENRTAPKAYDSRNDAVKEFHNQLSTDMGNPTLGWSICMVINSAMGVEMQEKYVADVVEETVEEVTDANN